ncbi:MAG TPA: sigma-54 dependent transcriptional regulator [Spirochaetia bacterium]|nr:sigma-54 dependent transcriptional regulator [Spirochaetia bacterium]
MLVVDDEKNIRGSIDRYLRLEGIESLGAENGLSAQRLLQREPFAAAVVDLKMPGMNGLELLQWIRRVGLLLPVIMISAYGDIRDAVESMKLGAQDYIVKPFDPEELVLRLKRILEAQSLRDQVELGRRASYSGPELIGQTAAMREIRETVAKIARTPSTVLITGESGTGKEIIARLIHTLSDRPDGPFMAVNVGGIPETLLESELFGYEKGAFTGASSRKNGIFELASSGTLFLDEVGDMPLQLQVKLLRVLQERTIQRLGGTVPIPVDVRILSATNRDVESRVKEGQLRQDLFYRLNVVRIHVPPLRERLEDIPALVGHLIEKLNRKMGKTVRTILPEALLKLGSYSYPGNVRELENIIERAFIFSSSDAIGPGDIDIPMDQARTLPAPTTLKDLERRAITEALHRWEGNRTRAARELGITRRTLINKINEYRLRPDQNPGG